MKCYIPFPIYEDVPSYSWKDLEITGYQYSTNYMTDEE